MARPCIVGNFDGDCNIRPFWCCVALCVPSNSGGGASRTDMLLRSPACIVIDHEHFPSLLGVYVCMFITFYILYLQLKNKLYHCTFLLCPDISIVFMSMIW